MSKPLLRNNFAADQGFTFKYQKKNTLRLIKKNL